MNQNTEKCPYVLAEEMGVNVTSNPIDTGNLICWYTKSGRNTYRVYMNPSASIDPYDKEKALYILLKHHEEAKGQERQITISDLCVINKIVKKVREIDDVVATIFLRSFNIRRSPK